jgi:hypothetical protein
MQLLLKLLQKQMKVEFKSKKLTLYSEKNVELDYEHCTQKFK